VKAAVQVAWDSKAEDIVVIDVTGRVSYADYVVVCSAQHARHAAAIAEHIASTLKRDHGARVLGMEGKDTGKWVLIDFGDFLVHVFERSQRGYYDIDSLWADAPRLSLQSMGVNEPPPEGGFVPQPFTSPS